MCGRYTLMRAHPDLEQRFEYKASGFEWVPRYNIAPTQEVLAVVNNDERRAELLRWGLIPSWAKDAKIGSRMINARAETVAEKPAFRRAFRGRRCLVIADGYYEWRKLAATKVPNHIVFGSGEPFAFAGLWEIWRAPDGSQVRSCTIVTTRANSEVASVHDRMPVILTREAETSWMDPELRDADALQELLVPCPYGSLKAYAVSQLVNSPKNDSPECVKPVEA